MIQAPSGFVLTHKTKNSSYVTPVQKKIESAHVWDGGTLIGEFGGLMFGGSIGWLEWSPP
jgi:hypothetical protein